MSGWELGVRTEARTGRPTAVKAVQDDDLDSDLHHGPPARLCPLPGFVPTGILSESAFDGWAIKALHCEPVPMVGAGVCTMEASCPIYHVNSPLFPGLIFWPTSRQFHRQRVAEFGSRNKLEYNPSGGH